ncbi:MAG: HAD family hydrolase [Chloroflexota bacterium]
MPLNGIKAILFDMDGTLRESQPTGGEVFTDYALSLGLPISEHDRILAARWEHYYFAGSTEIREDFQKFGDDDKGFWQNFGRRRLVALGCSTQQAEELAPAFAAHMEENYKPKDIIPEGVIETLEYLHRKGYVLGVVSNRDLPYHERLKELGLASYFSFSLAAGEVNSWKPSPGIFEVALKRAETQAHETVYVGDNYFADVIGARSAGLQPILYDRLKIFEDPGCPVITSFSQLPALLNGRA